MKSELKKEKSTIPFNLQWSQIQAIELCRQIEAICPAFGVHVALTGGLLYKDGVRNDCDIVFYRIREVESPNLSGLWEALSHTGFSDFEEFGFVTKARYNGKLVDIFYPESYSADEYGEEETEHVCPALNYVGEKGIPFTQFKMPDGKRETIWIQRPDEIQAMAKEIIQRGYRFEIEMLSDFKTISMEIINRSGDVIAQFICENGHSVPAAVDKAITEAIAWFSKKDAIMDLL